MYTFGREQFEVINTKDSYMIFKSKQPGYSYFSEPWREYSWDSVNDRATSPTIVHSSSLSMEGQVPGHMAKVVNISALPPDIMKAEIEEPNYFFESYNDNSTDFSYSLTGFSSPRLRNESGSNKGQPHMQTHSEDIGQMANSHNKLHYSWLDSSHFKPPPGFE